MAEYVKELTVPNSAGTGTSTYQIKEDPAIHYVTCGTAAATAAKTVTMSGFKLETGSWIAIKFTVTNTAAVADLTLNVNSTGAKGIKYRNGNLPAAWTLTANRIYLFVYDGTYWQIVGDLDTDSDHYDRTSVQTRIYAGTAGVFNYSLVGLDSNQRMQSFTTTSGTATSKAFNTGAKFLYPPTIMYHSANATVTNGNVIANNVLYEQFPFVDLRYSCNITSSAGFAQYKPVYIECTMDSNGYWSITSTGLTQTFTSGKYYILLGCMYNTSIYQLALFAYNPMFYYDGTSLTGIFPWHNKTLTASTVDSTPGSFMFQGNNLIGDTYDWVGVQVSSGTDKLQIMGSDGHLITRMDDSNDSSGAWSDWIQTMSADDVSGEAGITVTPTTKDIGTGDTKYVVKDGVIIKHSNSITAQTSAVFKKITYDAQGHITGTANVVKGDIPALDYVPNTSTGVSNAINLLIVGTSTPSLNDYYVSQYAAGGTSTTSYHRRPLSALWTLFKSLITVTTTGTGNAITAASISDDGNNRKITFTKGLTFSLSDHTHDYSKVSISRSLTSGTKIGTITIDGTATDLYCETNTNTDTKVNVTLNTSTKSYLLATTTTPTSTAQAVESIGDTNIWIQSNAVHAAKYYGILGPKTNDTRPASANVSSTGKYGMSLMIATSTMTTGKPMNDGYIINCDWDNTGAWGGQLFIPDTSNHQDSIKSMQWRAQSGSSNWSDAKCAWITLLDSHNYTDYCSKVSFTQNLSSGTKIGTITIDGTATDLYCETNTNTDTKVNVTLATTTKAYLLGTSTTPTSTAQAVTSVADTGVYLDTTAGGLCATNVKASSTVCANTSNSSTAGGISLYSTDPDMYGIAFRGTSNSGKHGYVQSDWATYFTMNEGGSTRGWVFRRQNYGNVASISGAGNAVFNGSVTVGGNSANTSGCRMTYNTTTQSLDFVFA